MEPIGGIPPPFAVAADRERGVWVALDGSPRLLHLDAVGRVPDDRRTLPGGAPVSALALRGGELWAAQDNGSLWRIDLSSRETKRFQVGAGPAEIAFDDEGRVWVTNRDDGSLSIVPRRGRVKEIPVCARPLGVGIGGGVVWVGCWFHDVRQIATGAIANRIKLGHSPQAVEFHDGAIWVTVASRE